MKLLTTKEVEQYLLCGKRYELARSGERPAFMPMREIFERMFLSALRTGPSADVEAIIESVLSKARSVGPVRFPQSIRDETKEHIASYWRLLSKSGIKVLERETDARYTLDNRIYRETIHAVARHEDTPKDEVELHYYEFSRLPLMRGLMRHLRVLSHYAAARSNGYKASRVHIGYVPHLITERPFFAVAKVTPPDLQYLEYRLYEARRGIDCQTFLPTGAVSSTPYCVICDQERNCPSVAHQPRWQEVG